MAAKRYTSKEGYWWTGEHTREPKRDCKYFKNRMGEDWCVALKCLYCAYEKNCWRYVRKEVENEN